MKRMIAAGVAMLMIAGCEVTQDMAIEKGTDLVAKSLKDPDSATFSGVFMTETDVIGDTHYGYLCGQVNSKNSFGGYTGNRRFSALFNYSTRGQISVSYVELEEGKNAGEMSEGVTYYEHYYWQKRCVPGSVEKPVATKAPEPAGILMDLAVGQQSMPAKQDVATRQSPDLAAGDSLPITKGQVVKVVALKDGWVQVSADPAKPQWIIPEVMDWKK